MKLKNPMMLYGRTISHVIIYEEERDGNFVIGYVDEAEFDDDGSDLNEDSLEMLNAKYSDYIDELAYEWGCGE
jgi:hypothetical protein